MGKNSTLTEKEVGVFECACAPWLEKTLSLVKSPSKREREYNLMKRRHRSAFIYTVIVSVKCHISARKKNKSQVAIEQKCTRFCKLEKN